MISRRKLTTTGAAAMVAAAVVVSGVSVSTAFSISNKASNEIPLIVHQHVAALMGVVRAHLFEIPDDKTKDLIRASYLNSTRDLFRKHRESYLSFISMDYKDDPLLVGLLVTLRSGEGERYTYSDYRYVLNLHTLEGKYEHEI